MYDLEKRIEAAGACRYPFLVRIKPSPGIWRLMAQITTAVAAAQGVVRKVLEICF